LSELDAYGTLHKRLHLAMQRQIDADAKTPTPSAAKWRKQTRWNL